MKTKTKDQIIKEIYEHGKKWGLLMVIENQNLKGKKRTIKNEPVPKIMVLVFLCKLK